MKLTHTPPTARIVQGTYFYLLMLWKKGASIQLLTNSNDLQTSLLCTWKSTSFEVPKGSTYCRETAAIAEVAKARHMTEEWVKSSSSGAKVRQIKSFSDLLGNLPSRPKMTPPTVKDQISVNPSEKMAWRITWWAERYWYTGRSCRCENIPLLRWKWKWARANNSQWTCSHPRFAWEI